MAYTDLGDADFPYYVVYGAFDMKYFGSDHWWTILPSFLFFVFLFLGPMIMIFYNLRVLVLEYTTTEHREKE